MELEFVTQATRQNVVPGAIRNCVQAEASQPYNYTNGAQAQRVDAPVPPGEATVKDYNDFIPRSTLWNMYQREAKEQDGELIMGRDKNLDTMLIFAGLFSAVLTAFLIESTNLLGPDQADITISLLLAIAQSQQRIEAGTPNPSIPPIDIPSFQPSSAALCINILWFLALAFSLGAAMIAMLAKEWLASFISYDTRDPYKYALERQSRFDGLVSWRAIMLIDFLPTMLHFSLLLFTLGLILRLLLINIVVAIVVTAVSGVVASLYLGTVILGALKKACPYQARMSKYIHALFKWLNRRLWLRFKGENSTQDHEIVDMKRDTPQSHASDMNALQWFLDYARDPLDINDAYLSLVADRPSPDTNRSLNLDKLSEDPQQYLGVLKFGAQAFQQLSHALDDGFDELALSNGSSAATFALVLAEIYPYSFRKNFGEPAKKGAHIKNKEYLSSELNKTVNRIHERTFTKVTNWWKGERPPFVPNAYAGFTTAELKIAMCQIIEQHRAQQLNQGDNVVSVPALSTIHEAFWVALNRASLLLHYHISQQAPMGSSSLRRLLMAIQALQHVHTLADTSSTPNNNNSPPAGPTLPKPGISTFKVKIAGNTKEYKLDPTVIDSEHGLLASLIVLSGTTDLPDRTQVAAIDALGYAAPVLISQWRNDAPIFENRQVPADRYQANPPKQEQQNPNDRALEQLMRTLDHLYRDFRPKWTGISGLSPLIVESLQNRYIEVEREDLHEVLSNHINLLTAWIDWAWDCLRRDSLSLQARLERGKVSALTRILLHSKQLKNKTGRKLLVDVLSWNFTDSHNGLSRPLVGEAQERQMESISKLLEVVERSQMDDSMDIVGFLDSIEHWASRHEYQWGNYLFGINDIDVFGFLHKLANIVHAEKRDQMSLALLALFRMDEGEISHCQLGFKELVSFLKVVEFVCDHPLKIGRSTKSFVIFVRKVMEQQDPDFLRRGLNSIFKSTVASLKAALKSVEDRAQESNQAEYGPVADAHEGLEVDNIIEAAEKHAGERGKAILPRDETIVERDSSGRVISISTVYRVKKPSGPVRRRRDIIQ